MSMDRWDPFREMVALREAADRLLQQTLSRTGGVGGLLAGEGGVGSVPLDIAETDAAYEVRASIPGVRPEDVQVTINGDSLTIRGETRSDQEQSRQNWLVREHRYGTFQRTVKLPMSVNSEQAEARCENGVLLLTLPKAEQSKPQRIPVGTAAAARGSEPATATDIPPPSSNLRERPTDNLQDELQGGPDQTAGGDVVTEASQESFPASDPPSWTPEKI